MTLTRSRTACSCRIAPVQSSAAHLLPGLHNRILRYDQNHDIGIAPRMERILENKAGAIFYRSSKGPTTEYRGIEQVGVRP